MASTKPKPQPTGQKLKILQALNEIEKSVKQYRKAEPMQRIKNDAVDRLWEIFGTSIIKPKAAPFVIGRMYEAFDEYRTAIYTLKKYEELEKKLVDVTRAEEIEAEVSKANASE